MAKSLFVGNIPWDATEEQIRQLFEEHGTVDSVKFIMDRESGRPRGIGFVAMTNPAEADDAMQALEGFSFMGRSLHVNEARPREHTAKGGYKDQNRQYAPKPGGEWRENRGQGRDRGERGNSRGRDYIGNDW